MLSRRNADTPRWAERMGYGRKGGTSVTSGRQAATYRVRFPDGTSQEKRSFKAIQPEAIAYVYWFEGVWHTAAIYDEPQARMNHYQTTPAERVR